jgi:2-(1,2-epoxy-1,2-dihydrophenyl)acetyl-CoA isomerase
MYDNRVDLQIADGVAHLRLVRADARNAIDPLMVAALGEAIARCAEPGPARALLITAEGPSFTVGGDLAHFDATPDLAAELDAMIGPFHEALAQLAELPLPVVCAAQGAAAGGGLGLLWCADVVIAADDLRIATGFAQIALSGDGGSSWQLPRMVGRRRAQELILEGRVLGAQEALEWGLVTRVVARAALAAEAQRSVRRLADGPTFALAQMRQLLCQSAGATLREQLQAEREAIVRCGATADAREGITAFAEHRPPRFGA